MIVFQQYVTNIFDMMISYWNHDCAKGQIAQIAVLVEYKAKCLHIHILIIFGTTSQSGQPSRA